MKRILSLVCSLALLLSAGVLLGTTAASADVVKHALEVDLDSMTAIPTGATTTPYTMVAVSPAGQTSPFSLAADADGGKLLQYSVAEDNRNVAHYLDFYVAAAPYARVVMKADIKEEGDPRPYFRLYNTGLTAVQNDLWADQDTKDGKTYTFTFNLDSTGTGIVRLNLGAYYLAGTRKTTDGSEAGTVTLDNITFDVENEYNELYTIGATDKLPNCAGWTSPVGLSIGAAFNGKYFSIAEENGERIVHYKNDEAKVKHQFISILDLGVATTEATAYTFSFDVKVLETLKLSDVDLWVKMYVNDGKAALCPTGYAKNDPGNAWHNSEYSKSEEISYTDLGVLEGGKYSTSNNAWKCGVMENVAAPEDDTYFFSQSKCADEYASINIKFVIPAGIRYVRMDTLLAQSANSSFEKNEMYIKNLSVTRDSVQKIVSAAGWQEDLSSAVYNLVDTDEAASVYANDLVFTSKNNPVIAVKLDGKYLNAGVDYTIAGNTVSLSADAKTAAAKKGAVLTVCAANGKDYTITVADLTSGNLWDLSVGEKGGKDLLANFDEATKTYTVKSDKDTVVLDLTTQYKDETVKINGKDYTGETAEVKLEDGENTIKVEVYKGTTLVNTYTVTVTYTAPTTTTTTTTTATTTTTTTVKEDTTPNKTTTTTKAPAAEEETTSPDTGYEFPAMVLAMACLAGAVLLVVKSGRKVSE